MKVYRAGWSRYQAFAEQFDIAPTPITSEKATLFIAHVGAQGLAVSTIEAYLAGLRHYRIRGDPSDMNPSLHTPFINLMLRGIKRVNAAKKPTQVRLPITVTIMEKIKHSLASEPLCVENRMVWAACCTGFFVFFRCAEFLTPDDAIFDPAVHLGITDISYMHAETQPYIMINVKASKTDQSAKAPQCRWELRGQNFAQSRPFWITCKHVVAHQVHYSSTQMDHHCAGSSLCSGCKLP